VLDFGISKFNVADPSGPLTVVGTAMGTPLYMSYEQLLSSNSVDLRTDVYALGVVLYECLTARHPFNAETLVALSVSIQRGEFSPVSRLRPDVPKAIDAFFASCLAPIRDQRPKDMADLCAELRKFITAKPAALAGHAGPGAPIADTQFAPQTPLVGSAAKTTRASTAVPATQHAPRTSPPVNSAHVPPTQLSRATTGAASSVAVPAAQPRSSTVPALVAGGVILLAAGAFAVRMQTTRSATTAPTASAVSASAEPHVSAASPADRAGAIPNAAASDALASPVPTQASTKPAVDPAKTPLGGEADARTRAKCARLLERLSLGETLGDQDARMYATACKKKRTP
jgi:eukaryotic-like serine/threonine-protein kinase